MVKINEEKFYKGLPNLRGKDTKVKLPKNYKEEIERIEEDIIYFAENYFYIVNVDKGKIKIKLMPFQKTMLKMLVDNPKNVFNCSRQIGKTTIVKIFITWYLLTNVDKTIGIASFQEKSSKKILDEIKFAYNELPLWLQFSVLKWHEKSIKLSNGCQVLSSATTGNTFRGEAVAFLYVDETAIIPSDLWQDFEDGAIPSCSSAETSRICFTSTPKGFNHFYQIVRDAQSGVSDFKYFEAWWSAVPGRGEEWKQKTMKALSGYNKERTFAQNYECAFLSESSEFLSNDDLRKIQTVKPFYSDEHVSIYEEYIKDHNYVIGVDTATGKGKDSSAFVVLDITQYPFKVVYVFNDNEIEEFNYAIEIKMVAMKYKAMCVIESNSYGLSVIRYLTNKLDFFDIVSNKGQYGIYTSGSSKREMITTMKNIIKMEKLIINDYNLFFQLSKFTKKPDGTYSAMTHHHDDLVMALGLAIFIVFLKEYDGDDIFDTIIQEKIKEDNSYSLIITDDDDGNMASFGFDRKKREYDDGNMASFGFDRKKREYDDWDVYNEYGDNFIDLKDFLPK